MNTNKNLFNLETIDLVSYMQYKELRTTYNQLDIP